MIAAWRKRALFVCAALLLTAAASAIAFRDRLIPHVRKSPPDQPSAAAIALDTSNGGTKLPFSSPFLNTGQEARYVGARACRDCHEQQHESFRHTGMGRSMAAVDLSREPPDGAFDHPPSKRRYEVRRKDGRMWHRELRLTGAKGEVLLQEHPVAYVTGSGRHSLTYVVDSEGFFIESPITWYASKQAWGMSPGYDRPEHSSFQREVGKECLVCHAGRVETVDRGFHRLRVIEEAIGCERCHGPGSLHVEKHAGRFEPADNQTTSSIDYTIVNPAHLSRKLAEAICQQCHLRVSATVLLRGKGLDDFRPGLPLEAFRQDFKLERADAPMKVVGHVEQMHKSACFQGSQTFTCVTCHDPHAEPPPQRRADHYKSVCLSCHQLEHCTIDAQRRARESADNNCVTCHMPTTPTDIPHLAFTHHRVGIHDKRNTHNPDADEASLPPAVLVPLFDDSHLSQIERQRALGLGYLDLAIHGEHPSLRAYYRNEARRILLAVHASGQADGIVDSSLASLDFELELGAHGGLAQSALSDPTLESLPRCNALFLQADWQYRQGRYHQAISTLESLSQFRRHSLQWLLRAQCEKELGNSAGVKAALLKAVTIDPGLTDVHKHLVELYRQEGDAERAAWHKQRVAP